MTSASTNHRLIGNSHKRALVLVLFAGILAVAITLVAFGNQPQALAQSDTTAPSVSSIAITSDPDEDDTDLGAYSIGRSGGSIVQSTDWASGVYRIGDDVHVTVTFSENVTVTDSPQLELTIGSSNRTAEYESTDGSVVVFRYTVAEGDTDSDGIAIGANKLTLRSGSIKDGADNDANLSHNALADQDGHKVDGIRPRIARFFLASSTGGSDGAYSQGEEMIIVAEFTEDNPRGSVNGPPQVKLDFDGEEKMARWDISLLFDSPRDYGIFGYVVQEGDLDSDGVAIRANSIDLNGGFIRDPAGNDAILTHSAVAASSLFKVDAVAPTVSSIAITSDPGDDDTYGIGDKIEVTVTFSENMSFPISITCSRNVVHCKAELELDIGGTARTADYQSHDGADVVYAYTVQAGDTDDNGISIGANNLTGQRIMDAAGRNGEGINDADLSHDAVADDESHKVSGNSSSLTLSGDTTINYAENSEGSVATYTLSGSDGTITWSLSGDDSDDFSLSGENATTRALSFASSPNYEDPTDGDINNQYDVTIQASDGTNSSTLQVTVIVTNVRHDADELPVITGTARVGETLTVDTSPIPDTDQNTRFGYLWIRTDGGTDTNIDGAANSSYTLTDDDEGKSLKVLVGFRTTGGERVRLTSEATAAVAAPPASNSLAKGVPTITGTAQVGGTLTADTSGITDEDGLNDVTFTHQWVREDSVVVGSAARSYTPTDGDRGKAIKVRVSFTDDAGNPETRTSAQTAAVEARSDTTPESLALVYDNNYPTGIWSNGTTIWVANFSTSEESRLYAYDLATWTHLPDRDITSLYDAGNRQPWGLWSDGAIFWVTDLSRSKIYAYDLTTGDYLPDRDIETLWTAGNERPLAIWSDGITLWVCDSDDEKIYAYDLATGERRSDRDINTMKDAGNHAAVGMWSDGVTMWVSDRGDDKIYAYELATGVRQPDLDFDELYSVTGSGSAIGSYDPLGLWSDSATMWVTDVYQFKVFAYDMPETAALKSLRLDGADSEFAPWRFNHTSRVTSTTTRTTVAATAVWPGSRVTITPGDADWNTRGHQVNLSPGDNTITVVSTNGDDSRTYTVTVTRTNFAARSDDATLTSLELDGINIGTFDPATTEYILGVPSNVSSTTVTATPADQNAAVTFGVEDHDTGSEGHQVAIAEGTNTFTVEVESSDGTAERTYTITVNRASDAVFGWTSVKDINLAWASEDVGPTGIWSDGTTIWVAKPGSSWPDTPRKIFAYDLTTGSPQPENDINRLVIYTPADIWSDGNTIWVSGDYSGNIYAYDRVTGVRQADRDITTSLPTGPADPLGLWSDGETIWVADRERSAAGGYKIFAYDLATGARKADRDIEIPAFDGSLWPSGLWSDGVTMWVPNRFSPSKIYAYNLATGARQAELEFNNLHAAGNHDPRGLWSDGETMWVSDGGFPHRVGKVFAYNMPETAVLTSLELTGIDIDFDPERFDYEANGPATTTVAAEAMLSEAVIEISPADADVDTDDYEVDLAIGETEITVTVTVGTRTRTYTVTVTRGSSPAKGAPVITGTAQVGQSLTADITGISDSDGLTNVSYNYQWLADGAEIAGATSSTYTLVASDQGKTIKVKVSFTDDAGNHETLTSAPTAAVSAASPPPPDNVRAVAQKSGAVELTWDAPDDATVTGYRIERSRADENRGGQQRSDGRPRDHHTLVEDTGSADTGYTDESAEKGVEYEYRVSARNESGTGEASDWVGAGPVSASNTPATGAPTIRGTAKVGQTLTAEVTGISDADGVSGETFAYQWVSSDGTADTDMENATGSTYKLVDADKGRYVKVRVTFTDDGGNEETLTSASTGPVLGLPGAPRNLTATPGNKEVTLSWDPPADNGNPPATRYRVEWRIDGKDYDKDHWGRARSTTYTTNDLANLANGVKYVFRVKAENGSGNSHGPYGPASEEVSATPTSGSAVDLGTPVLSDTETLHHGMVRLDWQDIEDSGWYVVQYYHIDRGSGEWLDLPAEGVDIAFHGSSAVVSNLHGFSWLRVGAMSCAGASEWSQIEQLFGTDASDWKDVPVPEVAEGDEIEPCPVVLGTPVLSEPENLHHGMVQLDWEDIEDAGWYVVQYYHIDGGNGEWLDLPAVGVDIAFHGSGAVVSDLDYGIHWLRVGAASCAGESEWSQIEELIVNQASDWKGVPVPEVAEGDVTKPCDEDPDTPDNSPATGAPTISGTAQVGETLSADTSNITDADGLTNVQYEYQWLADASDISGATNATYTLADTDEGKAIKVEVTFTDDADNDESLTSAATDAVAAAPTPNTPATGTPTITGTAQVGETLTAGTSGIADADGLTNVSFTYQWLADDADISGATGSTYTLADTDEGKAIKVEVTFTDDADNEETLTSAATGAAAGAQPTEPPSKPTGLEATATHDSVTLTWDDPGDDTITGYVILRRIPGVDPQGHFNELVANTGTAATTYTDDTVSAETRYTYRIKAINGAGTSERSRWSHIDTPAAPVPDKPTGLSATATHDSVTLTWDDPGDDSITGYVILRRVRVNDTGGDFDVLVADTGTAALTYTDDTVSPGLTYTYRIKAINEHGTSERSRWFHIDIPEAP